MYKLGWTALMALWATAQGCTERSDVAEKAASDASVVSSVDALHSKDSAPQHTDAAVKSGADARTNSDSGTDSGAQPSVASDAGEDSEACHRDATAVPAKVGECCVTQTDCQVIPLPPGENLVSCCSADYGTCIYCGTK